MLEGFDKAFESRVRLGIMSVLINNEHSDFVELKELLELSDGNLASHLSYLEKLDYVRINKSFIGKKPNTGVSITKAGRKAFNRHLDVLEKLIRK